MNRTKWMNSEHRCNYTIHNLMEDKFLYFKQVGYEHIWKRFKTDFVFFAEDEFWFKLNDHKKPYRISDFRPDEVKIMRDLGIRITQKKGYWEVYHEQN